MYCLVKKIFKKISFTLARVDKWMTEFKLVLFDMDGTLLQRRTIFVLAEKKGFTDELLQIINSRIKSYEKSIEIAKLLRGMDKKDLLKSVSP